MNLFRKNAFLLLTVFVAFQQHTYASGAYIPGTNAQLDKKFELGKNYFHRGTANARACRACHQGDKELKRSQLLRIKSTLAKKIVSKCTSRCRLHANAGSLSRQELQDILHYIALNYRL